MSIFMSDEAVGGGPDGAGAAFVGDGGVFAFGGGILEEGEEGGAVEKSWFVEAAEVTDCLLYTSPSPRD